MNCVVLQKNRHGLQTLELNNTRQQKQIVAIYSKITWYKKLQELSLTQEHSIADKKSNFTQNCNFDLEQDCLYFGLNMYYATFIL